MVVTLAKPGGTGGGGDGSGAAGCDGGDGGGGDGGGDGDGGDGRGSDGGGGASEGGRRGGVGTGDNCDEGLGTTPYESAALVTDTTSTPRADDASEFDPLASDDAKETPSKAA